MLLWNTHARDPSRPRPLCDAAMPAAAAGFVATHAAELRANPALRRACVAHLMNLGEYALLAPAQLVVLLRRLHGAGGGERGGGGEGGGGGSVAATDRKVSTA
jgi:hypothetical protein